MVANRDRRAVLNVQYPIIQAPMAGGTTTPALVAAVSNAGGLGSLGAAYLTPEQITAAVAAIRELTDRPFNVNLFAGGYATTSDVDPEPMLATLGRFHAELQLPPPVLPALARDPFPEQIEAVLAARPPVFSFTFGLPDRAALSRLKERGITVIGTATTVEEARQLAAAGVDAIVAQGSEAGAHRGTFAAPFEAALIGTMALVPQVVDAVSVPVVASGGIMDGRGIYAALALGASAVQMGTAFLMCQEAATPAAHRAAIRSASAEQTTITRAFSGRPARGLVNQLIRTVHEQPETILPFPLQNSLTRQLRAAAAERGNPEYLSLWAGQAAPLGRELPAAELVATLVAETRRAAERALPF
ncbi:MAG: DUF561 domain-containing protein [Chloroflexi bacterium]|nr:DUF561 domain-containing protein [Chloroflexota bacterium]